ncbi:MAG: signal peptide peptidase SppA, partial [Pedobacter sp.]
MRQFLKYVLATIVGLMLFSFVGFLLLVGIAAALSSSSDTKTTVKENTVLKLDLDKPIEERSVDNPFKGFGPVSGTGDAIGLFELKRTLKEAKEDKNIEGIYLQTENPMAG